MSAWASWVLCPTGGQAHLLAGEGPEFDTTQCGRVLPSGVVRHDRVPSGRVCATCVMAYFVPEPVCPHELVFPHKTPAGQRCSDPPDSTPGGQPLPAPAARWARCPVDQRLHLLAPAQAVAADIGGHGRAGCGRLIPAAGLTLAGSSAGMCPRCLAVASGTVP